MKQSLTSVLAVSTISLLAGPVLAQSAPAASAAPATPPSLQSSPLTRDLNSGPPVPATYLAPAPAPVTAPAPVATPAATSNPPVVTRPAATTPAPVAAPPVITPRPTTPTITAGPPPASVAPTRLPTTSPPVVTTTRTPAPTVAAPTASPPVVAAPRPTAPAPTPVAPATETVPAAPLPGPPPGVPGVTVLDSAARAALPFSVDLPPGFEIVTGRPGPDFRIYTIRRTGSDRSSAMIYVGPTSQFPIYSGETVEAGGRASRVVTEDGQRIAREHLFQRPTAPREIHVWTMTLEGAEMALAERIAQSVDVR